MAFISHADTNGKGKVRVLIESSEVTIQDTFTIAELQAKLDALPDVASVYITNIDADAVVLDMRHYPKLAANYATRMFTFSLEGKDINDSQWQVWEVSVTGEEAETQIENLILSDLRAEGISCLLNSCSDTLNSLSVSNVLPLDSSIWQPNLSSIEIGNERRTAFHGQFKMDALPEGISNSRRQLERITVAGLGLKWLPEEIGTLVKLESLIATSNSLTHLPFCYSPARDIQVAGNKFRYLPDWITNLEPGTQINLRGNPVADRGTNRTNFLAQYSPRHLNFANNLIRSVPPWVISDHICEFGTATDYRPHSYSSVACRVPAAI